MEIIDRRYIQAVIHVQFMILFLIFIISCNGQDKSKFSQDPTFNLDTISSDSIENENQPFNQNVIGSKTDPLFYIDGQLCQHLRKIFQDSRGDLWFGTNNYDIMRFNGDSLEYFSEKDGLAGGRVTGIVEDKDGNVWFGASKGLTKYDPSVSQESNEKSFTIFSEEDGLIDNEIWSLMLDENGIFWIGTTNGISRFDGKKFRAFDIPRAYVKDSTTVFSFNRITSIVEDKKGVIWFGTDGFGICKYDPSAQPRSGGKIFTHLTKEDGLPGNNIREILEDSKGNIWIGTSFGGISRFDGTNLTNFTEKGIIDGVEVGGIHEDKTGNIWFAAENFGVYRYNGSSFTNFYKKEGLNTNGVLTIFEDNEGRYWLGGWGGLFRYYSSAKQVGEASIVSVTYYGPWEK